MTIQSMLAQNGLFAGLPEAHLAEIAGLTHEVTYGKGAILFQEGDRADSLFLLVEGRVDIQAQLGPGPNRITTTILNQPGKPVGWSGLFPPHSYTAAAVCQEESRLLVVHGADLAAYLAQHPETGYVVMQRIAVVISERLRNLQQFVLKTL
jgi:CRP-like cAMP-binding protein